ncbi:MAG: VWA domain-containing protein [Candidatus Omnitrophica bacterium]|nr:VWA domain-containing protein [Candidatus Omnitrophota bacterium]
MEFKTFWILFLIPVVLAILWALRVRSRPIGLKFPSKSVAASAARSWKTQGDGFMFLLRLISIGLFLFALAGPRLVLDESKTQVEGINIMLALDASGSMAALDFQIEGKRNSRLDVVKKVVEDFISKRSTDKIGLVVFGGLAYTVCPLTTDYDWLRNYLDSLKLGTVDDGTAIGSAIASATLRLKEVKAKSKVIILLTDGLNNRGTVSPVDAAFAAKANGIKIYTIGVGARGLAPFPVQDQFGRIFYQNIPVDIDEDTLKKVADMTGGKYYRATDTDELQAIYREIDALEKIKIDEKKYYQYKELFDKFLLGAVLLLLIEIILRNTLFLKIP